MFELYRKRLGLYGKNENEAILGQNQEIMNQVFTTSTTYKRVRVGKRYYDARFMRDVDKSAETNGGNFFLQFRGDQVFPVGTYVYILDRDGTEVPWLLITNKEDIQFPKNCIVRCDYALRWLYNYKLIEYPVALRTKNSYTDGVHQAEEFNTLDNQAAFWIPYNDDTQEITYNMRFLLSNNPKHPQAYSVTKVNDILRPGVIEVILLQDQLGEYDNGELMCADYNVAEWVCDLNILNTGHSLQLAPDDTFQFEVSGVINELPVDITYCTFASSNPDVAVVDKDGKITALDTGDATITVTLGNVSQEIALQVSDEPAVMSNIQIIDPDGDYIMRLRFEKELRVMLIHNGQQVQNSSFVCEILEGADIAQYQIDGDKIILSAGGDLSNIGRVIKLRVYNEEYSVEATTEITVKGVI